MIIPFNSKRYILDLIEMCDPLPSVFTEVLQQNTCRQFFYPLLCLINYTETYDCYTALTALLEAAPRVDHCSHCAKYSTRYTNIQSVCDTMIQQQSREELLPV